jgi:hypothetical protein
VVERQLPGEVALHRPVHVLGGARRQGADEAPEVLDDVRRIVGHAREPGRVAHLLDEPRLAQQQLRLPGRPQARPGVADEREAQPAVLVQDALALVAVVVPEPPAGAPDVHVVHGQRGRDLGHRRARELLGLEPRHLGQQPQDAGAAGLGHRQEEDAQLGQDHGALEHVLGERHARTVGQPGRRLANFS